MLIGYRSRATNDCLVSEMHTVKATKCHHTRRGSYIIYGRYSNQEKTSVKGRYLYYSRKIAFFQGVYKQEKKFIIFLKKCLTSEGKCVIIFIVPVRKTEEQSVLVWLNGRAADL